MTNYGENIKPDLREQFSPFDDDKPSFTNYSWSETRLRELMTIVDSCVVNATSMLDLAKASVTLGQVGRKLDLTGSNATSSSIRHLKGTVSSALHFLAQGYTVHVIESCDDKGHVVCPDLDLGMSKEDEVYACDYTSVSSPRSSVFVVNAQHSNRVKSKYNVLTDMFPECIPWVICDGSIPPLSFTPEEIIWESPREQDFKGADEILKWLPKISEEKMRECLDAYSDYMEEEISDKRGMVEQPRNVPIGSAAFCLSENSPQSAREYVQDRSHWGDNMLSRFSSGSLFDAIEETEITTNFKLPLYHRSQDLPLDPFERCSVILNYRKSRLMYSHPLLVALSTLTTSRISTCRLGNTMATLTRIYHEDRPTHMVNIKLELGSMLDVRNHIKASVAKPDLGSTYVDMETKWAAFDKDWMSKGNGSYYMELINSYISSVMGKKGLAEEAKCLMRAQLDTISDSKIMSWISQLQELTTAMLITPRVSRLTKEDKGNIHGNHMIFNLSSISDRLAVVLTGAGSADFGSDAPWSYMVLGCGVTPKMCMGDCNGLSRFMSMSHAQLDWYSTILMKSVSYYTLLTEQLAAVQGGSISLTSEQAFPMAIMVQNNNKFAQWAEMTRYILVNGLGFSSSPVKLWDKVSWFRPTTFTQKLYAMRLMKTGDLLQVMKSNDATHMLRDTLKSKVPTKTSGYMNRYSEAWMVALPHESRYSSCDHAFFNGMYICRAMTIQRYNKLTSESLVLAKQLDSRQDYLQIKNMEYDHELRFVNHYETCEEFLDDLCQFDDVIVGPWSTSWRAQVLSIFSTKIELLDSNPNQKPYEGLNLSEVMRTLSIGDVMNSRGSVSTGKTSALVISRKIEESGKLRSINQNNKCWHTLLEALQCLHDGIPPPHVDYDIMATQALDLIEIDLDSLSGMSDRLWPLILWASENGAMCVSKMVHKDQIGSREIAVLNAWSRIMCYYVEMLARKIRDFEHLNGVHTNLIERHDKESQVDHLISKLTSMRHSGYSCLMDSGDCSTWGPSMMCANLYLTIASRMDSDNHRRILRNCLSLFGSKIFKIPDVFYESCKDVSTTSHSMISKVQQRLINMTKEMGSFSNQYIKLEESMHQGILGCSSSVFGADAHNLSNYVLRRVFKTEKLIIDTRMTSDDYTRTMVWSGDAKFYQVAKQSLAVHNAILLHCGIKRNLQKSALSRYMLEFNSVFHTLSGEFRPDMKQRLALVDYGHSLDWEPNAIESYNRAAEYLRMDGGIIGSCWISVLNNCLTLIQNQNMSLYQKIGDGIHNIPLELGGLIRPMPMRWISGTKLLTLTENYSEDFSTRAAYQYLLEGSSGDVTDIAAYVNDKHDLKISSMSRSGVIKVSVRPKRSTRAIFEYLQQIPEQTFRDMYLYGRHCSLLQCLMACSKREVNTPSTEGSSLRLANCMHTKESEMFWVNCDAFGPRRRISRLEIEEMAVNHRFPKEKDIPTPFDHSRLSSILKNLNKSVEGMKINVCSWLPRHLHDEPIRIELCSNNYVPDQLSEFDDKWSPFRGNDSVSCRIYLESRELLRQRLNKLMFSRQTVKMALMEGDELNTTVLQRLYLSNYYGGARADLGGSGYSQGDITWDTDLELSLSALSSCRHISGGHVVRFGSPRYSAMMRKGLVSKTDITGVVNIISGDMAYHFTNETLKVSLVSGLYKAMSEEPTCFVINPQHLSRNFTDIQFTTSKLTKFYQRSIRSIDGENVGREFIKYDGTLWQHYYLNLREETLLPEDTQKDIYSSLNLMNREEINVYCNTMFGSLLLTTRSNFPLQVLSQTLLSEQTVMIWTKTSLADQLDELCSQGVYDEMEQPSMIATTQFLTSRGYYPPVSMEKPVDIDIDVGEVGEAILTEQIMPSGLTLKTTEGPHLNVNDLGWSSDEEGSEGCPMDEDYDSESDVDSEEDIVEDVRPMSESNVSTPHWFYSNPTISSQVVDVTRDYKDELDLGWRDHVYQVTLPVDLPTQFFRDDARGNGFLKLLEAIGKLEPSESSWARDYLITGVSHLYEIRAEFENRKAAVARGKSQSSKKNLRKISWA